MRQQICIYLILVCLCSSNHLFSQGFIFNQLFQPSVRLNAFHGTEVIQGSDYLSTTDINMNCIIPISSRIKLDIDWKKVFTLKFKKSAKIKLHQVFWNFRPRINLLSLQYQMPSIDHPFSGKLKATYGLSTGVTGVHLISKKIFKPKLLFYQFNIGLQEDELSIQTTPIPTISLLAGIAHIKSPNFFWYYGVYFNYNNGLILPAPFFGLQAKLLPNCWLSIVLPVQIRMAFKLSKRFKLDVGASISGFSTAFGYQQSNMIERYAIGGTRLKTGFNLNIKLSNQLKLYIESGVIPLQFTNFRLGEPPFAKPNTQLSAYGGFALFYSFKKSLLGSTIDSIILF